MRVAIPAPAELGPAFTDPEGWHSLVTTARSQEREAVVFNEEFGVLGKDGHSLGDGQRGAPPPPDELQGLLGSHIDGLTTAVDVRQKIGAAERHPQGIDGAEVSHLTGMKADDARPALPNHQRHGLLGGDQVGGDDIGPGRAGQEQGEQGRRQEGHSAQREFLCRALPNG